MYVFKQLIILLWCAVLVLSKNGYGMNTEGKQYREHVVAVDKQSPAPATSNTLLNIAESTCVASADDRTKTVTSYSSSPNRYISEALANKSIKNKCSARITCCGKIMRCGGSVLCGLLVAATTFVGVALWQATDMCSQLILPVQQISNSAQEGLVIARDGMSFVNKTAVQLHLDVLDAANQARIAQVAVNQTCKQAQASCDAANESYKVMRDRCARCP